MRAAVVQMPASEDKPANLKTLQDQVRRAAGLGAQLVVGPEAAMHDFGPPDLDLTPVAEPLDGLFVTGLQDVARETETTVLAGMFEAGEGGRVFNTVVAVDGTGSVLGAYRKLHLFDALGWVESDRFAAGDGTLLVLPLEGLTIGVQTCYDLRFPELSRALVDRGADVLVIPAAWVAGPQKQQQWTTLVAARAIESTAYVVAACQSPPRYVGASRVIDPMGEVLAGVAAVEGVAVAELLPERVVEVRTALPSLRHRRLGVTAEPSEPTEIRAPGVAFDKATGTLRIEAADDDLSLELIRGSNSITGVLTSRHGDSVVQEGVGGLQRVIIAAVPTEE